MTSVGLHALPTMSGQACDESADDVLWHRLRDLEIAITELLLNAYVLSWSYSIYSPVLFHILSRSNHKIQRVYL